MVIFLVVVVEGFPTKLNKMRLPWFQEAAGSSVELGAVTQNSVA